MRSIQFSWWCSTSVLACLVLTAAAAQPALSAVESSARLRQVFLHPPLEARPRGYWVWPHGNFDYSTIRRELEAFKAKGLGGVDIFDLGIEDRANMIPPGPGFMSSRQVDGIAFALSEAKRLGLKMGLIVSSSWNAGGTWTPPEQASMNLVAWKEAVSGPARYERVLPLPKVPEIFRKPYGTFALHVPRDDHGEPRHYEEVAVLAYPVDAAGQVTDLNRVVVLTDRVDAAGKLSFDLPAGNWVVMRAVLVNFGQQLWLPSDNSQGLIMDHFSRSATRAHFEAIIDRLESRVGPLQDTALERLYLASYEANADVIWTPGLEVEFEKQNGYSILSYLPALFGSVVVDEETTARFLYDYRKTVSELFLNHLYLEASRICREHGLLLCSESGGPGAPLHDVPTEDLKALGAVDIMRGEFWVDKADRLDDKGFEVLQVVKQIASAAHIYGRRIVEMEAFTSHLNWQEGPDVFKRLADRAFCEGMTRVVYHTMSHNLPEAGKPGWTYQAGSHMNTNLTWWSLSDQLHAYLSRSSALLMQGDFVADVVYYYGNEIPNFARPKHLRPGLGRGYDYDDLNTEILLKASVDEQGRILLPSGMRYSLLVLPQHDERMDLAVLKHIERLLMQGATVIGTRPSRTYGLRGFPEEQLQLRRIANRIWGEASPSEPHERRYGRGRVLVGRSEREVLQEMGVTPNLEVYPSEAHKRIDYIHRRTSNADLYLVRNTAERDLNIDAHFRVGKRRPELWDAVTGSMTEPAVYLHTQTGVSVPMHLTPHGSVFVVFLSDLQQEPHITAVQHGSTRVFPLSAENRHELAASYDKKSTIRFDAPPGAYTFTFSDGHTRSVEVEPDGQPLEISGPWEVRFRFGWGVPTQQVFDSLLSWTEVENAATRSFSGIATYSRQFFLDGASILSGQRVLLDLGQVREVARVYLNGHDAGLSSFAPHVLNVTDLIRAGENSLVVEVANTWLNRLIADDAQPDRKTQTNLITGPIAGQPWRNAQPQPSGLLGPVRVLFPRDAIVARISP